MIAKTIFPITLCFLSPSQQYNLIKQDHDKGHADLPICLHESLSTSKAISFSPCPGQKVSFLQRNGGLQAYIQEEFKDTRTQEIQIISSTKPVILHPDFSITQFLNMPFSAQKNYWHQEPTYIYLGFRGLKGGDWLSIEINRLTQKEEV